MHPLNYASSAPPDIRLGRFVADEPALGWIFRLLSKISGSEAYLVGGTTRDTVTGRLPNEIHVVVRNVPEPRLEDYLQKEGKVYSCDAASFALTPYNSKTEIDVRLPRTAFWNKGARERRVIPNAYLPLSHDLAWRDFTANAIAYSINNGFIIDPFGGVRDLEAHKLRSVGDPNQRFLEDPLRTLRALRLAAAHNLHIDDATWQALKATLPSLHRVITDEDGSAKFAINRADLGYELIESLTANVPYLLQLWESSGAADLLFPELEHLHRLEHHDGRNGRKLAEELWHELHARGMDNPHVFLVGLLHFLEDSAEPTAQSITERFQLPLAEHDDFDLEDLKWFLEHRNVLRHHDPEDMRPTHFARVFHGERGNELLHLLEAIAQVDGRHNEVRSRLHKAKRRRGLMRDIEPPELIRGRDVVSLGIAPGPHIREVLATVRDAQLEGKISTKEEALNVARQALHSI